MNLKFRIKKSITVKFFHPWDSLDDEEIDGMSLTEAIVELIWDYGGYRKRISDICERKFSVKGWDWEEDGDDYIEVRFNDSDQLAHDLEELNCQFSNEWDKLVITARKKLLEEMSECCNGDCTHPLECPNKHCNNNDIPEQPEMQCTRARNEMRERNNPTPPPNIWNATTPLEKEKDEWNVWNR